MSQYRCSPHPLLEGGPGEGLSGTQHPLPWPGPLPLGGASADSGPMNSFDMWRQ